MNIRFKVDEDLPTEIGALFRAGGYDAITVLEQKLGGTPDSALWDLVQRERRCLVTADKGFASATRFPPGSHAGIVLFRLPRESRNGYADLAQQFLSSIRPETIRGTIVSVSPDAIRVHGHRELPNDV